MPETGLPLARIVGTGSYVPDKVLTNADFERMVDTSDEWITTRTGIKERRMSAPTQATSDLALEAGRRRRAEERRHPPRRRTGRSSRGPSSP